MNPVPLFLIIVTLPLLVGGCGEKDVTSLKYEIKGDSITITGCDKKVSGAFAIPATIEGKVVTNIGHGAFKFCSSLTSITIPDSVTSIGVGAFSDCSNLRSITIGDSVTSIDGFAFARCSNLKIIMIPDSVTSIGRDAFIRCTSLTSIIIAEGVTDIGSRAFNRCASLTAVTLLGDAPKVGSGALEGSPSTIYRKPEAKGWGDTFGGRPVKLISEKP